MIVPERRAWSTLTLRTWEDHATTAEYNYKKRVVGGRVSAGRAEALLSLNLQKCAAQRGGPEPTNPRVVENAAQVDEALLKYPLLRWEKMIKDRDRRKRDKCYLEPMGQQEMLSMTFANRDAVDGSNSGSVMAKRSSTSSFMWR